MIVPSAQWARALATGLVGVATLLTGEGRCESPRPAAPTTVPGDRIDQAILTITQTGRPAVFVVTSRTDPASKALALGIAQQLGTQGLDRKVQFVELPLEAHGARLARIGITKAPAVVVYRRGRQGLELAGHQLGVTDAPAIGRWLSTLGLDAPPGPEADPSVVRTNFDYASPQALPSSQALAPPLAAPPASQAPQAAPTMALMPVTPAYSPPAQSPVVVSAPSAPVVFQPQAPTIVVGPQPPPNIVFAQAPQSAPTMLMAAPAGNAPQNLFLSAPAASPPAAPVAAAPGAVPMMAAQPVALAAAPMTAQPMVLAAAPAAAQPPALAAQPAAAPVAQQSPVATAAVALLLENPSLIERLIGAIGRILERHGRPRVMMSSAPQLVQAPIQAALASPTALAVPATQAATFAQAAPSAPTQPSTYLVAPASAPQLPPLPSPQQASQKHHRHFFDR